MSLNDSMKAADTMLAAARHLRKNTNHVLADKLLAQASLDSSTYNTDASSVLVFNRNMVDLQKPVALFREYTTLAASLPPMDRLHWYGKFLAHYTHAEARIVATGSAYDLQHLGMEKAYASDGNLYWHDEGKKKEKIPLQLTNWRHAAHFCRRAEGILSERIQKNVLMTPIQRRLRLKLWDAAYSGAGHAVFMDKVIKPRLIAAKLEERPRVRRNEALLELIS